MGKIILTVFILLILISVLYLFPKKEKLLPNNMPNNKPNNNITTDVFTVELKIHDRCPKTLIIQNDGTVILKEGSRTKDVEKTNKIKVSLQEIKSLKQYILDNNFFSLKEKYEGSRCCDFIAHTIIVTIGDKTHTVYCYNDCPKEFDNIIEKIESLWPNKIEYCGFA